jgi:hypothetical protein
MDRGIAFIKVGSSQRENGSKVRVELLGDRLDTIVIVGTRPETKRGARSMQEILEDTTPVAFPFTHPTAFEGLHSFLRLPKLHILHALEEGTVQFKRVLLLAFRVFDGL